MKITCEETCRNHYGHAPHCPKYDRSSQDVKRSKVMFKVRLRNLTTRRLHTDITHVYQDIEFLTGVKGVMTHCIPAALRGLEPYLRRTVKEKEFWDDSYDPNIEGTITIESMNDAELKEFWRIYKNG